MNALITINQAAELLHLAKATLYKYITERRIPYYKVGTHPMFDTDELIAWQHSFRAKTISEIQTEAADYCLTH